MYSDAYQPPFVYPGKFKETPKNVIYNDLPTPK